MIRTEIKPKVAAIGLSLELYRSTTQGIFERFDAQFRQMTSVLAPYANVSHHALCGTADHVKRAVIEAESAGVDALLIVPLSYTASGFSVPALFQTAIPLVVWNTQFLHTITPDYTADTLMMNHAPQGAQDVTCTLIRSGRRFGLVSGHYQDLSALLELADWLMAARAMRFAQQIRVGLLGHPFDDMNDFAVDFETMKRNWGPQVIPLELDRFIEMRDRAKPAEIRRIMEEDRNHYEIVPDLSADVHAASCALELALRELVDAEKLDAFTMNFLDLINDGRCGTMPFHAINKLADRLGYAGEGDVATAAHCAQLQQLAGDCVFTEIYTIDYNCDSLLMTHMQECNPGLARKDRKVRLIQKPFWAGGVAPYAGMHFTLQPGPVTLTSICTDGAGSFYYTTYEAAIRDMQPLEHFAQPHWMVQLSEPAGDFLTRYSRAGGQHHLAAAPVHCAARMEKLAVLQGFSCRKV